MNNRVGTGYEHPTAVFTCKQCGNSFTNRRSRKAFYCSRRCAGLAQTPHSPPNKGVNLNQDHFWGKVSKTDACWIWNGHINNSGYGHIRVNGKMVLAHRHAWFLTTGENPDGLMLHHCDVKSCVNPSHLYVGSHLDNMRDAVLRNRLSRKRVNAVLSENQVRSIRSRYRAGESLKELAKAFGTTRENIFAIKSRRTWRDLED